MKQIAILAIMVYLTLMIRFAIVYYMFFARNFVIFGDLSYLLFILRQFGNYSPSRSTLLTLLEFLELTPLFLIDVLGITKNLKSKNIL